MMSRQGSPQPHPSNVSFDGSPCLTMFGKGSIHARATVVSLHPRSVPRDVPGSPDGYPMHWFTPTRFPFSDKYKANSNFMDLGSIHYPTPGKVKCEWWRHAGWTEPDLDNAVGRYTSEMTRIKLGLAQLDYIVRLTECCRDTGQSVVGSYIYIRPTHLGRPNQGRPVYIAGSSLAVVIGRTRRQSAQTWPSIWDPVINCRCDEWSNKWCNEWCKQWMMWWIMQWMM